MNQISQGSSQEDHDFFWELFLSPLLKKRTPLEYDPGFKKSLKQRQLVKLEKKPLNQNTCLSGIFQEKLREQHEKTEIDKKRRVSELNFELSHIVNVSQVKSQADDSILLHERQATDSSTTEKALNSSQAAPKEFGLTTEETSKHEEDLSAKLGANIELSVDNKSERNDDMPTSKHSVWKDEKLNKQMGDMDIQGEEEEQLSKEEAANLKKVTNLVIEQVKIAKEKSHQQRSASSWELENLKLYIKRDDVQLVETLVVSRDSQKKFDGNCFQILQNNLILHSRQLLDDDQHFSVHEKGLLLWSLQFTEPMFREQLVCFMVREIIGSLCDLCKFRMKPEEALKNTEFPTAIADFALDHNGAIFGVVEVKTPKTMNPKAVVQLLINLLNLQCLHNEERMQYLGILTDGFRFILVRLQGDKFTFESTGIEERPEINIRTAVSWDNLSELCEYLRSVLGSFIANLLEITKK